MIESLDKVKRVLARNRVDLAFIVGNGINRYAYGAAKDVSWVDMLLDIWKEISPVTLSTISKGISLTEFYDIMEFEAGSDDVVSKVAEYIENLHPAPYHTNLRDRLIEWNVPLLTTNFDRNLSVDLKLYKFGTAGVGFTDYYPWGVYFSNAELKSPTNGFGVWHINGMVGYRRSIRLGLSAYTGLSSRVREHLHKGDGSEYLDLKDEKNWKGFGTWLNIIFNRNLCIFGLGLDENETFSRWLLIERARYFRKFPEHKKSGWYVCRKGELSEGKRFFLNYVGIEIVSLDSYDEIYKGMFDL